MQLFLSLLAFVIGWILLTVFLMYATAVVSFILKGTHSEDKVIYDTAWFITSVIASYCMLLLFIGR